MPDLLPIYQAIEFIEARLRDEVTVAEIASAAGYSLFHFIRAFNQVVWHTPYDYLMRRRLSEAAYELVASDRRVFDIALEYRFNNHETFSRAFKRLFGMQPVQWRERGVIPRRARTPAITYAYLEHIHQPGFQRPQRVTCQARRLAGLMAPLTSHPEAAVDRLWRDLGQVESSCLPDRQRRSFFGVTSYLDEQGERIYYLAACELDILEAAASLLACQTLPAGDYIRIAHNAPLAALPHTLAFLYSTWLPKAGLRPAYPVEIIAFGPAPPWVERPARAALWLPVMVSGTMPT